MYKRIEGFLHWCVQGEDVQYANQALLCIALISASLLSFFTLFMNYNLHFPPLMIGINSIFCLVYPLLYWKTRFASDNKKNHANLFVYLTLFFVLSMWPLNAGSAGPISLALMGHLMLSAFILDNNKSFLVFLAVLMGSYCTFFALDIFMPQWLHLYPDLITQKLDMGFTGLFLLLIAGGSLSGFRVRYEKNRQALQRSVDYKSRFLAQMSHEMRTPLNAIIGFSKLLSTSPVAQKDADLYLKRIYANGISLMYFFDDLLDISKIEEGKLRIHPQKISLQDMIKQCNAHFSLAITAKNLHYQSNSPADIEINTDPQRLKQVLNNLLSNAIKFTPPNGRISLTTFFKKDQLCIEVVDSGPGIKQSEHQLVFKPFYRSSELAEGSGLGLAIVKELCDLMNYQLHLKSNEGQGCCFQVWIPL